MQQPTSRNLTEVCKMRQSAGLPANHLLVFGADNIHLTTPKGSMPLCWDGQDLVTILTRKALRLNQIIIDQLVTAISHTRPARYEYKHGWEIQDGDREGWDYCGDSGASDERSVNRYCRQIEPMITDEIWFSAADLVR